MGVDHYENFPVASLLCPPALRPAVRAIYHFARTADDIADEGDATAAQRLADLAAYRNELTSIVSGTTPGPRWPQVFTPLAQSLHQFQLPSTLLHALLDAFEQDVHNPRYARRAELLTYCARSANPVGRLLLHLYGIDDAPSLRQSDAICSALQLINFWQDLGVDAARGRFYVPLHDLQAAGLQLEDLQQRRDSPAMRTLVRELCAWAQALMHDGSALAARLPGRAGWELALVTRGGLRILEKIGHMEHTSLQRRPKLNIADAPLLLWRTLRLRTA